MPVHNLNLKIFVFELVSFAAVGILGILAALEFRLLAPQVQPLQITPIAWWQFLLAFGVGTALVLGLVRISHGGFFLRLFFIFALFAGTLITLDAFLSENTALILAFALITFYVMRPSVWLHDLILIFTLPGIAALIGLSFEPFLVAAFLIVMSVYDYIAVYKTKHMVKMAKAMIAQRAIFAMIFPENWRGFKAGLSEAHPGEGFMMLGSGDFVFPVMMAVSALSLSQAAAWLVLLFSALGLLAMHLIFISQKVRRPMPALPPLAAFAILGFLVASFLMK